MAQTTSSSNMSPTSLRTIAIRASSATALSSSFRWLRLHDRGCVPRFVDAELSTTRQRELREQSPPLLAHWTARELLLLHVGDEGMDVIAHEIELVNIVLIRSGRDGVHGNLRWRKSKDQPTAT